MGLADDIINGNRGLAGDIISGNYYKKKKQQKLNKVKQTAVNEAQNVFSTLNVTPEERAAKSKAEYEALLNQSAGEDFGIAPVGTKAKRALATTLDISGNILQGGLSAAEGVSDFARYGGAGLLDLVGAYNKADEIRWRAQENDTEDIVTSFKHIVQGDLNRSKEDEEINANDFITKNSAIKEDSTILGANVRNIFQGVGNTMGYAIMTRGLGGAAAGLENLGRAGKVAKGAVDLLPIYMSATGGGQTEAYNEGATDEEAALFGTLSGLIEAGTESMFGGLGAAADTLGVSGALGLGKGALDDKLVNALSKKFKSTLMKNLADLGIRGLGEGTEEFVSGVLNAAAKKMTYMSEKDFEDLLKDQNLLESFISGTLSSVITQAPANVKATIQGREASTGITANENRVIEAEVENRTKGQDLTKKEISKIRNEVREDLQNGYISTDVIEQTLGKDYDRSNDSYLQESYNEKARKQTSFNTDLSQYKNENQRKIVQKAIDSGILNDSKKTHNFVDLVSKIAADKGMDFDFVNNQKIKDSGFAVEGKTVNGYVNGNTIGLNIESNNALNKTVGHEITHVLEGSDLYQVLQDSLKSYIGEAQWNARIKELTETYKNVENADVTKELTADLVGENLFNNEDFVRSLSTKNRNLFEKIYDEIKYLVKIATAGSKEKRELVKLQKTFQEVYRDSKTTKEGTQYSIAGEKGYKNAEAYIRNNFSEKQAEKYLKVLNDNTKWFRDKNGDYKFEFDDSDLSVKQNLDIKDGSKYKLKDILKHDSLFAFYPEIANYDVVFKNKGAKVANYNDSTHTITINPSVIKAETKKIQLEGILLHEIQHAIQHTEGFEAGESMSLGKKAYYNSLGEIEAADTAYRRYMDEETREKIAPESSKQNPEHRRYNEYLQNRNLFDKIRDDIRDFIDKRASNDKTNKKINSSDTSEELGTYSRGNNRLLQREVDNTSFSLEERVSGDKLLDAQDLIQDVKDVGAEVDDNGYVTVYHQTTNENAQKIRESGEMYSNEPYVFFSTSKDAQQSQGRGETKLEFKIPAEDLILDDLFSDNADVKIDLNGKKTLDISNYLVNDDTKYSLTDNQGRQLSEEQQEYFKDSKVRDEDGNLETVYHQTKNDFTEFKNGFSVRGFRNANFFTNQKPKQILKNMLEGYVKIDNPLYLDNTSIQQNIVDDAIANGYDGIINQNVQGIEGKNEIVTFNSNQFKNVDNTNPTSNPDIRYSLTVQEANTTQDNEGRKLTDNQLAYFKDSKAVDENGNLVTVYHTMTNTGNQFFEFNPVGTDFYRFGDQVVNYFTDNQDMSGSYADSNYKRAYTKPIKSMEDVQDFIKFQNTQNDSKIGVNGITSHYSIEKNGDGFTLKQTPSGKEFLGYDNLSEEGKVALNRLRANERVQKEFEKSSNPTVVITDTLKGWDIVREYKGYPELAELVELYDRESQKLIATGTTYEEQMVIREILKNDLENYLFGTQEYSDEKVNEVIEHSLTKQFENEQDLIDNIQNNFQAKYQYAGYINMTNPYVIDTFGENWDSVTTERNEAKSSEYNRVVKDNETKEKLYNLAQVSERLFKEYSQSNKPREFAEYSIIKNKINNSELREVVNDMGMFGLTYEGWLEAGKKNAELFGEEYKQTLPNSDEKITNYTESLNPAELELVQDLTIGEFVNRYGELYKENMKFGDSSSYFKDQFRTTTGTTLDTDKIGYSNMFDLARYNFDGSSVSEFLDEKLTTNDLVKRIIEKNNSGETNYDGLIMKNVYDYGGQSNKSYRTTGDIYVTFNSNQFKAADNTTPTADSDIRYSLTEMVDSEDDAITQQQFDYFKNTKAVDDLGELWLVHHGTPNEFNVFDIEKAGKTGLMFGNGFYFTNSSSRAEAFTGDNENGLKSGYINIEKPASRDTKTMTYKEFKDLYEALNKNPNLYDEEMGMSNIDALLSDYGDIYNDKEGTLRTFYDSYDNDVNLIDNLSYMANPTEMYKTLRDVTGYDGIIVDRPSDYDSYEKFFIAFNPDQFKLKTNKTPTNDVDMRLSLTRANEDIAPTQGWDVRGRDIALESAIAPLQEQVQQLQNTIEDLRDNLAPISEEEASQLGSQFDENEIAPTRYNLTRQESMRLDILDMLERENQLTDNLAEERNELMAKEENAPEGEDMTPIESLTDVRDMDEVAKDRSVNAYQYEHPEVKPYFQEEARVLLAEINEVIPGERFMIEGRDAEHPTEWLGYKRQASEDVANLLDGYTLGTKYTKDQLREGLNAIIDDHGLENKAVSKRLEFMLDDRLRNGYETIEGYQIEPNQDYLNMLKEQSWDKYYEENPWLENAPAEIEDDVFTVRPQEIAPVRENTQMPQRDIMEMVDNEGVRKSTTRNQPPVPRKQKGKVRQAVDTIMGAAVNRNVEIDNLSKASGNRNIKFYGDMLNGAMGEVNYDINTAQTNNRGEAIGKSIHGLFAEAKNKGLGAAFNDFLINYSNIDRYAQGKGSQTPLEVSKRLVRDYAIQHPEFKGWAKDVWNYGKNARQNLVDAGLIDQQTADYLGQIYPHYVPYVSDYENADAYFEGVGELKPRGLKRARGGAGALLSVEDALARYTYAQKNAVRQNELYKEIVHTLGQVPSFGIDERTDYTDMRDSLFTDRRGNYLTAYEDGKQITTQVSSDLYKELSRTTENNIKDLEKKLSILTTPLQKISEVRKNLITTWNPTFPVTNAIKDLQDALFNSKHTKDMVKNYPGALKELATGKGKEVNQFLALYGSGLTMGEYSSDTISQATKKVPLLNKIRQINEIVELAPRYAEFKASLQNGETLQEAIYNAREVTTNFNRGGNIAKAMNRNGFTFLNASIQGFDKFIRNFSGENGARGIVQSLAKVAALGILPALFNHLAYDDDEEYEELKDYIKDNYYLIKTGDGKFIRIPKGRMLSIFGSAARRALESASGEEDAFEGYLGNAWNQIGINDPGENNIFAPFIQAFGSENGTAWYGGDIVPSRLQDKPKGEQYDETTDKFSIWLGGKLGVSPKKINYALDQYLGGIGDVLLPMGTEAATSEADSFGDYALAPWKDKFSADSVDDSKYPSDFYSKKDEITAKANSEKATDEDILKKKYLDYVSSQMSELYKQKREVQSNPDLTKKEKYNQASDIKKQINELAKEGLDDYTKVEINGNYAEVNGIVYKKGKDGKWTKQRSL